MIINLRCHLTGEPITIQVEVERGYTIQSIIAECCNQLDLPLRKNLQLRNENDEVLPETATVFTCAIRNSDTLYLTLMEDHRDIEDETVPINQPLMPTLRQPTFALWLGLVITGSVCVILSVVVIITLSIFYVKDCGGGGNGLVFDAGSSHTSMYIYSWPDVRNDTTGKVKEIDSCEVDGGGISSYADRPQEAGPSLHVCLDKAEDTLDTADGDITPQYLGATAGMRVLNATEPSTSDAILNSVRAVMDMYPFSFHNPSQQARILEGGEEGTFGWVSANYLSNTLNEGPATLMESVTESLTYITSGSQADPTMTLGAMDLGGASTQMTFIPEDPSVLPPSSDYFLRLYGTDYHVYSHSYLCYGINEALRGYKALLVQNSNYANVTTNPCGATGYTEAIDSEYLWSGPCGGEIKTGWRSIPPPSSQPTVYYLKGSSDATECAKVAMGLFNFSAECPNPPCSFNGVHQPKPFGKFLAFSVFAKIFQGLNISSTPTKQEIDTVRNEFCTNTYDQIKALPGFNKYLLLYCFEIQYIWSLLVDGYQFGDSNWKIEVISDINDVELGWSLGYMINATNRIPQELTCVGLSNAVFYGLLSTFILIFIVGTVLLVYGLLQRRTRASGATKEPYEGVDAGYGGV